MKKGKTKKITSSIDTEKIINTQEYDSLPQGEKSQWVKIPQKYEKLPLWSKISIGLLALSIIIYIIICTSTQFADFFNRYVSGTIRFVLAQITSIVPFSIAEALILLIPVILFLIIGYVWKYRCNTRRSTVVTVVCILSVASLFVSSFVLIFSADTVPQSLTKSLG